MRIAAHLCRSRQGVFYFRWPLPRQVRQTGSATDIKISLGTRLPDVAAYLSRLMVLAGQSIRFPSSLQTMRYDEMKKHVHEYFRGQLVIFKERLAASGPDASNSREIFETALAIAHGPLDDFMHLHDFGSENSMLAKFLEERSLGQDLPQETVRTISSELQKAYSAVLKTALGQTQAVQSYDFDDHTPARLQVVAAAATQQRERSETLKTVVQQYIAEGTHTGEWRAKTISEKEDALSFLRELIGDKPVSDITKADARKAKEALLKLPKNRRKAPATRTLSLTAALAATGVERISSRTINSYISHFQSFMEWSGKQGHCEDNPFKDMRVSTKAATSPNDRQAFTAQQLQLMFLHLTSNPNCLVTKDDHKWPTLIGVYSGARLNEIAQLYVEDIVEREGIWCFDINDAGEKTLKNKASRRLIPVHQCLLDLGLLAFVERRKAAGTKRLFPSFTYTTQNGYGRNLGRWFNASFLPALGMKEKSLMFHCLRHTMITRLGQADVPEGQWKALMGHAQEGVTYISYFKQGFTVEQLQREINKFSF